MAKNRDDIKLTVTPEILTLNNGTVAADINVTFPVEYFNKAIIKSYSRHRIPKAAKWQRHPIHQGSKVDENYAVVDMSNGGNYTQHVEFPVRSPWTSAPCSSAPRIKCPKARPEVHYSSTSNTGAIPHQGAGCRAGRNDAAAKAAIAKEFGC